MINIQATLRNASLAELFGNNDSSLYTMSTHIYTYIYIYIYIYIYTHTNSSQDRDTGRTEEIKALGKP